MLTQKEKQALLSLINDDTNAATGDVVISALLRNNILSAETRERFITFNYRRKVIESYRNALDELSREAELVDFTNCVNKMCLEVCEGDFDEDQEFDVNELSIDAGYKTIFCAKFIHAIYLLFYDIGGLIDYHNDSIEKEMLFRVVNLQPEDYLNYNFFLEQIHTQISDYIRCTVLSSNGDDGYCEYTKDSKEIINFYALWEDKETLLIIVREILVIINDLQKQVYNYPEN